MEGIYILSGVIIALAVVFFFLMEHRLKKIAEEVRKDQSSQTIWAMIQQQIEKLREQMNDGLARNISQLSQQQDTTNAQLRGITDQVNRQLQNSSGEISKRLDNEMGISGRRNSRSCCL